jgi:hypothetical protein
MGGPAQLNFLTLACADVERMSEFLRAFGWAESRESSRCSAPPDERGRQYRRRVAEPSSSVVVPARNSERTLPLSQPLFE